MLEFWNAIVQTLHGLNAISVLVRLLLAGLISGAIGLNREKRQQAAGFRTHMLVCVAACLVMMTGLYLFEFVSDRAGDPARLAAQVISGIGFLGAGTIIVSSRTAQIRGLTTAASLWAVACIGIAAGCGFYLGAIVAGALMMVVVSLMAGVDRKLHPKLHNLHLYAEINDISVMRVLIQTCKAHGYRIINLDITRGSKQGKEKPTAVLLLLEGADLSQEDLIANIEKLPGVNFATTLDAA